MPNPDQNSQTLIPATTSAVLVADRKQVKIRQENYPATLFATGLAGSETVTISISPDGGETFSNIVKNVPLSASDINNYVLTATHTLIEINSPMTIGVIKSASTAAVGVFLNIGPRA